MSDLIAALQSALMRSEPVALVRVAATSGSSPRDVGALMIVTGRSATGTVGGGTVEADVIEKTRRWLLCSERQLTLEYVLGPEIGQCCGGRMSLHLQRGNSVVLDELRQLRSTEWAQNPIVVIYGAGHVGRALCLALDPLPFQVRVVDEREAELSAVVGSNIIRAMASCVSVASTCEPHAAHVVMTHSHSLDSLICVTLLERGDFSYLGLIGSKSKKASFMGAFRSLGLPDDQISRLTCPVGGSSVRDKRPSVISAMIAAELLSIFYG